MSWPGNVRLGRKLAPEESAALRRADECPVTGHRCAQLDVCGQGCGHPDVLTMAGPTSTLARPEARVDFAVTDDERANNHALAAAVSLIGGLGAAEIEAIVVPDQTRASVFGWMSRVRP